MKPVVMMILTNCKSVQTASASKKHPFYQQLQTLLVNISRALDPSFRHSKPRPKYAELEIWDAPRHSF